jgi:UDP-N-acetylmuramate--alanine ligase
LAEIVNAKKCIAITGTHGKSTTTSMLGILLADGKTKASTIVGTQVPQLQNSNFYYGDGEYFIIEACEYKRSFLKYFPFITVITNIELDHLDYYRDIDDYLSAFQSIQDQTSGYIILN